MEGGWGRVGYQRAEVRRWVDRDSGKRVFMFCVRTER